MSEIRVRFAPSPTGPLHIGGVRTALYNYLFAKKNEGKFILRIEDTDQNRYVEGAENYIIEALNWVGLTLDEGPGIGGTYGPYRQSERKELYKQYALELIKKGAAYYAFDTQEELEKEREKDPNFKYSSSSRGRLRNSLNMAPNEYEALMDSPDTVIRLLFPKTGKIQFEDEIRGTVTFDMAELDDKVILKADGMPTYHLANIVDDHLMKISHVIRGEEWLSSTAHHVFMYDSMGWSAPVFAHLPLILKPTGKGKLSKRDGAKFGIPVFPLTWDNGDEVYPGFREEGFLPEAMINFLALLGWSPKTDHEIYPLTSLIRLFSLENIVKSGARFDIDKAQWFNQQYIIHKDDNTIAEIIEPQAIALGYHIGNEKLAIAAGLMKERVNRLEDILIDGYYLFEKPKSYEQATLDKKLKEENIPHIEKIAEMVGSYSSKISASLADHVKNYITDEKLGFGAILPVLRIALTGTMQGPDLFDTISFIGYEEAKNRILELINQ